MKPTTIILAATAGISFLTAAKLEDVKREGRQSSSNVNQRVGNVERDIREITGRGRE